MKGFIKNVIFFAVGVTSGVLMNIGSCFKQDFQEKEEQLIRQEKRADRNNAIIEIFAKWMQLKQDGKSISTFFDEKGYHKIAIYGMHHLGECLLKELSGSSVVEVKYAIDRNAKNINSNIKCVDMKGSLEEVDAIVVTPVISYFEIENELSMKIGCPIISIEDIIIELY